MTHDPKLSELLERLPKESFAGLVYRYTSGSTPPRKENTSGARWDPREVPVIYTTLERQTAIAELEYHLGILNPRPTRLAFTLYKLQVSVRGIVDLRARDKLLAAGITDEKLAGDDMSSCQAVGDATHWYSFGGLLVPSARCANGSNLVIFTSHQHPDFQFEVIEETPLSVK